MSENWRQRIVIDPAIHHCEPCIKGTRVPVSVDVGSIADGDTSEQILEAWPQLTGEDVKAALKFAGEFALQCRTSPLRIIAVRTLREFWNRPGRSDAEQPLRAWVSVVKAADWSRPIDLKEVFRSADILPNDRVVFNIGGNKYRLVVAVDYHGKRVFVRFIGTHAEYDRIDAATI